VSTPHAQFDVEGPLAFLTFNRPEARNAMTWEMYEALIEACDRVDQNADLRVLVLRGAGGKAFVSGTDISQFTRFTSRDDAIAYERRLDAVFDRLERVGIPTIAQIQGAATGGGCVIALCCDFRVCTPASQLGVPIARTLGNCLSSSNYARLLDLVGPARLKDLLFTGRLVDAAEASALGLVSRVVEADRLDAAVRELAAALAANAPLTIRATKDMVRRLQASRRPPMTAGDDWIAACYGSSDFKDAVSSFLDRRPAVFRGK
jgi:enoyl-CoA hydratase/carnithine racemase